MQNPLYYFFSLFKRNLNAIELNFEDINFTLECLVKPHKVSQIQGVLIQSTHSVALLLYIFYCYYLILIADKACSLQLQYKGYTIRNIYRHQ